MRRPSAVHAPVGHIGFVGVSHRVQVPGLELFFAEAHRPSDQGAIATVSGSEALTAATGGSIQRHRALKIR